MRPHFCACCARCDAALTDPSRPRRSNARAAALALAAIVLYPAAITLPMLRVEQLGHASETSIIAGITALFANGQFIVGMIVLLCSVIFPLGKLAAILMLSIKSLKLAHRHRAMTYRMVEWTGRWGMLDVLLVAVLVAALKLGDAMEVTPGPAAAAFAACVVLSLFAAAAFNPHALWESHA